VKPHGTATRPMTTTKPQDGTIGRERRALALNRRGRTGRRPARTRCGSAQPRRRPAGSTAAPSAALRVSSHP
jgi:hypothetical protein